MVRSKAIEVDTCKIVDGTMNTFQSSWFIHLIIAIYNLREFIHKIQNCKKPDSQFLDNLLPFLCKNKEKYITESWYGQKKEKQKHKKCDEFPKRNQIEPNFHPEYDW